MPASVWSEIARWVLEERGLDLDSWNGELGVSEPTRKQRVLFAKILGSFASSYRLNERTSTLLTVGNAVRELHKQAEAVNSEETAVERMALGLPASLRAYADGQGDDQKNSLGNCSESELRRIGIYCKKEAEKEIRNSSTKGLYEAVLRTNCRVLGSALPESDDFLPQRHPFVICKTRKKEKVKDDRPLVFLAGLAVHERINGRTSEDDAINFVFQQAQKYKLYQDGQCQVEVPGTKAPWEENSWVIRDLMQHSSILCRLISNTICDYLREEVRMISDRLVGKDPKTYGQVFGTISPDDAVKFSMRKNRPK